MTAVTGRATEPVKPRDGAFPEPEHRVRLDRAREALTQAGLDACICTAPEHLYYFSGYDGHTQFSIQAIVLGRTGEPTLVLRDVDMANAEETCWVRDIRTYHHGATDPVELIAKAARERTGHSGRIGLGLESYSLPGAAALRLVSALGTQPTDASKLIERLRYQKSARELEYIRRAGQMAEVGLSQLRAAVQPDTNEFALAGVIEAGLRRAQSEYSAMPTWLSTGWRTRGSHRTPTQRTLAPGEPIKTEFAGVSRRYHAVTMQTLWLGEPSLQSRHAYNAALGALRAGSRVIQVGVPVAEAEAAAFAVLRRTGFNVGNHARFGYGVSAAYPPSWLEGLDITGASKEVFQSNTAFVLHSYVTTPDGFGILIGGAYILTSKGLECLSGGDLELAIA